MFHTFAWFNPILKDTSSRFPEIGNVRKPLSFHCMGWLRMGPQFIDYDSPQYINCER